MATMLAFPRTKTHATGGVRKLFCIENLASTDRTTPKRWKEIDDIFAAALECDSAERLALLAKTCGQDEVLRTLNDCTIAGASRQGSYNMPFYGLVSITLGPILLVNL
jgi:hypothetical protein